MAESTELAPPAPEPTWDASLPTRGRRWRVLRWAVAVLLAAGLVVAAVEFRSTVGTTLHDLRAPAPGWLAGAIVLQLASMGLYARMQRRLLRGAGTTVPLRRAMGLAYAAHSMSMTLPGGPLISTVYNYRRMRTFGANSVVAAWATAASGILSGIGLVLLILGVGAVAAVDDTDDVVTTGVLVGVVVLAFLGAALLRRYPGWRAAAGRPFRSLGRRLPDRQRAQARRAAAWLGQLLEVRIPHRDLVVATGHSVGNWVTDAACLGFCCLALGVTVPPLPLAATYLAGMTASSLPLIPGGLGTVDTTLTVGLVASGVLASPALAVVVLYRLISFALIGAIGWVVWIAGRIGAARHREA